MSHFTIDQAGKIENTAENTILACYSNEIQYSIKVPKKLKQEIFNSCYKKHKKRIMIRMFSFCVSLLLKDKINEDSLVILDNEYDGHQGTIKQLVLTFSKISKNSLQIKEIGKKDPSHRIANQTFSGKIKPNKIITVKELSLEKIFSSKKVRKLLK